MEETLPDYYLLPVFPSGNIEPYNVPAIKLKLFKEIVFIFLFIGGSYSRCLFDEAIV